MKLSNGLQQATWVLHDLVDLNLANMVHHNNAYHNPQASQSSSDAHADDSQHWGTLLQQRLQSPRAICTIPISGPPESPSCLFVGFQVMST